MKCSLLAFALILAALAPIYAQVSPVTCTIVASVPLINAKGESELVSELKMTCMGGVAPVGPSPTVNFSLFLNVNATSRITNPVPVPPDSEALLLVDDPLPGVANISNGCPYFGQVLGASGVPACLPGSGNVYQGKQTVANGITWFGVPFVPGGTHTFRFTNIRANPIFLGGGGIVMSFVSISGPVALTITNPVNVVAQVLPGLGFSSTIPTGPGRLDLQFNELFLTAFLKRIENTVLGPLTAAYQDIPGTLYCTQSGFTPEFDAPALTAPEIGAADTGTRLLAQITSIPVPVAFLMVPNQVTSSSGNLVAHLVRPPFAPNFTGGTVLTGGGNSLLPVSSTHTLDLLYEVTAAFPFAGINGCSVLDDFLIHTRAIPPVSLAPAIVNGHLAPLDPTGVASATAPEPRFVP